MAKSNDETMWWSLFAAGGVVAALVVPALILITGLAIPFVDANVGPVAYGHLRGLAASFLGRVFLFPVISLPLFHCAHRFRHTLKDLGIHGAQGLVAFLCYGAASVGTGFAAWLVCTL